MHGYLAFDAEGELLVPFRTWRNTTTGRGSRRADRAVRRQHPAALVDRAPATRRCSTTSRTSPTSRFLTTLAGYVHWQLTGRKVLGVGDASGMFPIDPATRDYDAALLGAVRPARRASARPACELAQLLPEVLVAGQPAGAAHRRGRRAARPVRRAAAGHPALPARGRRRHRHGRDHARSRRAPATSARARASSRWSCSSGRSRHVHHELDLVTTPAGDPVAMVHCNNGASELAAWVGLFARFADASRGRRSTPTPSSRRSSARRCDGEPDAGGLLAYNHLAGEPIAGLDEGRPLFVRTPDSRFTLANFMRAQLYGVFGTLAPRHAGARRRGRRARPDVRARRHVPHRRRRAAVPRRRARTRPSRSARPQPEGGAWGIAVLAAYLRDARRRRPRRRTCATRVFARRRGRHVEPDPDDVAGFAAYLARYRAGLAVERAAVAAPLTPRTPKPRRNSP